MYIRLKEIELCNFGIFKDTVKLNFDGKDVIGILAEYANDVTRSNRSGKTLLLEAIKYALTGSTRSKKEVDLIHYGQKLMYVVADFIDTDGNVYKIKRGRDYKNNGLLELDWIDKKTEAQKAIEDLFGVYKDDFDLTNFFKQSDINGFMNLSPSDKTSYLMKWLDNNHWKLKEELVKDDIKDLKDRLKENETVLKALESSIEIPEEIESSIQLIERKLKKTGKQINIDRKNCDKLRDEINVYEIEFNNAAKLLHSTEKELDIIIDAKYDLSVVTKKFKKVKKHSSELVTEKEKLNLRDRDLVIADEVSCKLAIKKIQQFLDKTKESNSGMCPILNESCDRLNICENELENNEKNLIKQRKLLVSYRDELLLHEDVQEINDELVRLKRLSVKYKTEYDNLKIIATRPTNILDAKILKYKKILATDIEDLDTEYNDTKNNIIDLTSEQKGYIQNIGALEQKIKIADETLEKVIKLNKICDDIKETLSRKIYVAQMFGRTGIPADEIENAFHEVQSDMNFILKELGMDLSVVFMPDRELNKWAPLCVCSYKYPKGFKGKSCPECDYPRQKQRKDEISLKIIENGIEKDFSIDSGGGRVIISYVVRVALTMLKRRQNKSRLNILFLDEIDSALDNHLATKITDSITSLLTKKLGYDQIIMVSHKEEIKNAVPYIIKVIRHKEYSTAAFI